MDTTRLIRHRVPLVLGLCCVLATAGDTGAAIVLTPGANTVSTSRLELDFGAPNVERVDSVRWRSSDGILGANLVAAGGPPPACTTDDVLEAWGQAYGSTFPHRPTAVAAGATGTWTVRGTRTVEIESSVPFDCFDDGPTPVRTRYTFFDDGAAANQVRIERRFEFGPGSPAYATEGLRPYVVRLSSTPQMLFPDASGTQLVTAVTSAEGTITDDWNGTWLALDDPNHRGVLILRDPANTSPAKLILDHDAFSGSYLSSVDLTRPTDGWKEPLTEVEYLCFYDAISWPVGDRAPDVLPAGCTGGSVPINTTPPSIDGAAEVDGLLTASAGTWDFATGTFTHRWLRCDGDACIPISGAETVSYAPTGADVGLTLRVEVTAVNPEGEAETASATSDVITTGLCPGQALCQVDDETTFRTATGAMAVTGVDADGLPLPVPDLGAIEKQVTLGAVTLKAKGLFVGAAGNPEVAGGDWTPLLPGPDIALTGKAKQKKLELKFAAPIFAAGFEMVEPEAGPNVGPKFRDATFTLRLKHRRKLVAETVFSLPNDVAAFVGLWADRVFDTMEIRSGDAAGTKILGKISAGYVPGFSRRRNTLVVSDPGMLTEVRFGDGARTRLQDFADGGQGATAQFPFAVATQGDVAMVLVRELGASLQPALLRVDLRTGIRTLVSDFANPGQGPVGPNPSDVAIEASGEILVIDGDFGRDIQGALFRIDPFTGLRTVLSDFGQGSRRGQEPTGIAIEASGHILIADSGADVEPNKPGFGALFRVNPKNGTRTVVSDFGSFSQGPTAATLRRVAVEPSGQILVLDSFTQRLFRVDPTTGNRAVLSDFTIAIQGQDEPPRDVGVEASGQILVLATRVPPAFPLSYLIRVHPLSGYRTPFTRLDAAAMGPNVHDAAGMAIRR